jgi:alkanesulfonate monooxygenase SsuD/methylene tetrahydromethanopterin reductase-like flavin-dependent oxidoreductase (luciferase family)
VAIRPSAANRWRPQRTDLRGLDTALGPRRTDRTATPRAAGDQQPLPSASDAGQIAATVDVVSDGRLNFGIGVGSRPSPPEARREYPAHGLPYLDFAEAVESLGEACTVIRRLWIEKQPFDFDDAYHQLTGAFCNPKPVQQPYPPIMIGGRTTATLRVVAEPADLWNIPGSNLADAIQRSALLDRLCAEIGRTPPRSPAPSTSASHTSRSTQPKTRSQPPSPPAFSTSSSGSPLPIPTMSRTGSPTSSSTASVGGPTSPRSRIASEAELRWLHIVLMRPPSIT